MSPRKTPPHGIDARPTTPAARPVAAPPLRSAAALAAAAALVLAGCGRAERPRAEPEAKADTAPSSPAPAPPPSAAPSVASFPTAQVSAPGAPLEPVLATPAPPPSARAVPRVQRIKTPPIPPRRDVPKLAGKPMLHGDLPI